MKLIAVDAGHGMNTPGKRTPVFSDGTVMKENEFNRVTADYLVKALNRNSFKTILTAPDILDTPLQKRVQKANEAKADAFICIHANAYGDDWNDANGIESWVYEKSNQNTIHLAEDIQKELIAFTKRKNRGVKKSNDLYVLRNTNMMAVLVECGFLTNFEEATLLRSENYRKECAEGICKGICKYYNISYKSGQQSENDDTTKKELYCCEKRYQNIDQLPYGKEVIRMLIDKGILKGNEKGDLDLTLDMVRLFMILDRIDAFEKIK
ncbi:N-acetylmuramoyl-L-alanine amidase [Lachnospiraceae bacterium 46-61]